MKLANYGRTALSGRPAWELAGGLTDLGEAVNTYPVWVYPPVEPVCPPCVHECRTLDDEALAVLEAGGTVYLSPDSTKEALPHAIQAQFSPDFWSVGTFPKQEGGMGQLIDAEHPILTIAIKSGTKPIPRSCFTTDSTCAVVATSISGDQVRCCSLNRRL